MHDLLPPSAFLAHQLGAFEHGNMLVHRGEAHGVAGGERRHRLLALEYAIQDVATCRVGERLEQAIHFAVAEFVATELIYNHLVVCYCRDRSRAMGSRAGVLRYGVSSTA